MMDSSIPFDTIKFGWYIMHCKDQRIKIMICFLLILVRNLPLVSFHSMVHISKKFWRKICIQVKTGVQWLSGRVLDSTEGPRIRAFPASLCCGP